MNLVKNLKSKMKGAGMLLAGYAVHEAARLEAEMKRSEMCSKISILSSPEFAYVVMKETRAEANLYGIETELEIQEQVCKLLARGVKLTTILKAVRDKKVGELLMAADLASVDKGWYK